MRQSKNVKIVVFVPVSYADVIREVIGKSEAGKIGDCTHCSFSSQGIGRFIPNNGAHPTIGQVGKLESVQEERIEFICGRDFVENVVAEIKKVHPYEEVAFDLYSLEEL
ncbi:MAG: hypothetical protein A3A96_01620 [Candidatus Zambryskibacteria bacterium RIFCSPLOWO2_01_FULL_39_39]|uniref:NGG1p interacting factor NIF3 n=1 Tax=Candidatus Zambryskibacteria bacterium RIFCSPLOWO2_01_FULL_39_39 TaxID=1802758 RepID=A0A1G2TVY2_9BACT|nr:MAG: NIF3-like protein [Parcubacteria group bacterium GW2011_GWA1_47_10]OHA86748.1 MAG: hypothetical protein A2644_00470 [Candidatus Zambryskibacteria bacterium RIFCSPHIGHO2_01_FULL_39_63]OHA94276.1 MAG: hypothetical protein A3B88_03970 [Candidatus Zambryskibacteria bacterium RIFCSPHIGHO2_02_FULL_39_19]OHA98456.1 MAG: hypothetical protein A3F20_03520 [Candidatus Zambryskibacteria bacterium RIFCSPHIGHO2_12_FULL_39_21]OHB01374.1 MAG: hypothetical protein A3A96_01620 [Candidatus Zambryskibacter